MTDKRGTKPLVSRNPQKPWTKRCKLASRKTLAHMNLRGNDSSAPAQRCKSDACAARRGPEATNGRGCCCLGTALAKHAAESQP